MSLKTKNLAPVYHLEYMSIAELATELNIPKYDLLRYMQNDGLITRSKAPADTMISSGYMFRKNEENGIHSIIVTSPGYFFLKSFFKTHLKRHKTRDFLKSKSIKYHSKNKYNNGNFNRKK